MDMVARSRGSFLLWPPRTGTTRIRAPRQRLLQRREPRFCGKKICLGDAQHPASFRDHFWFGVIHISGISEFPFEARDLLPLGLNGLPQPVPLPLPIPTGRLQKALPVFTGSALRHYRSMLAEGSEAGLLDPPPERMSTFVFGTRAEWAAWTSWRLGRGAKLYLGIERGGYTIDAESVIWDIGRYDTLCMLAHEGWHQYTQSVFRHPLPAFLEEGLAAYAEGHRFRRSDAAPVFMPWRNLERYGQLRSSKYRGRLIDLDELVAKPPQYVVAGSESGLLTFYAQVWVLVHYLMEGEGGKYRAGLIKLVRDAVDGHVATSLYDADRSAARRGRNLGPNTGRDIIATYFDEDYQSFKAGYEAFIDRVVASGNGTKIWQGRSPIE